MEFVREHGYIPWRPLEELFEGSDADPEAQQAHTDVIFDFIDWISEKEEHDLLVMQAMREDAHFLHVNSCYSWALPYEDWRLGVIEFDREERWCPW